MWTPLSVSRWIFLPSLAVLMLVSVSQVDSFFSGVNLPCCYEVRDNRPPKIEVCYEQKPREDCNVHAFLIKTKHRGWKCISPTSQWLLDKIEKGVLHCPPDLSPNEPWRTKATPSPSPSQPSGTLSLSTSETQTYYPTSNPSTTPTS